MVLLKHLSPLGSSPNGKAAVPTHTIYPLLLGSSAIKPRGSGSVDGPPLQQQAVQSIATTYPSRPAIYDLWFRQYSCGRVGVDWNDASSFLVDQVDLSEEQGRPGHQGERARVRRLPAAKLSIFTIISCYPKAKNHMSREKLGK